MSRASSTALNSQWPARQRRTQHLVQRQPHAAELLAFYAKLLTVQEPLYHRAGQSDWLERVRSPGECEFPTLRFERLPLSDYPALFQQFLDATSPAASDVLAAVAHSLRSAGDRAQLQALHLLVQRRGFDQLAQRLQCQVLPLVFFPRAFLQPIAEALAERDARDVQAWSGKSCPRCGWPPQVAVIRDEPEIKGRRLLVCSFCASWWPFRRSTCAGCGEANPAKLVYHLSESIRHVRVEECKVCGGYLKSVDLRKDGTAVPLVDDIASVELDLWSGEQGLRKIQCNVVGL